MNPRTHEEEWDTPPAGMVALLPGDVLDRGSEGQFIVVRLTPSWANIRPLTSSKRTVTTTGGESFEVTSHGRLIQVSRFVPPESILGRDVARLNELLNRTKGTKMLLEPGDLIGLSGYQAIIFHVTETTAQAILNRRLETIDRHQSEFLLMDKPRKSPEEREAALAQYLKINNLTPEELTANTEKENEMKTRTRLAKAGRKINNPRGGLAAAANGTASEAKAATTRKKSGGGTAKPKTGRSAFTRELAADLSKTPEEIHAVVKPKFANADLSTTRSLVTDERAKLKKAEKNAEEPSKA